MKGQLVISELMIDMEENTGKKYLYGSLVDFYADTKEGLEKLTGRMMERGLFDFNNTGRYEGINDRNKMHWTFDDGKPSVDWMARVARLIQEMNDNGDQVELTINKKYLLDNGAVTDQTTDDECTVKKAEKLINTYVYYMKQSIGTFGSGNLLKTQVQGRLYEDIPSKMKNGKIYIEA